MTDRLSLPALPDRELLADLCREAANRERLQPHVVEKDFYLTRLLWALGETFGTGTGPRRKALEASMLRELQAVLRLDEQLPDLEKVFERFNRLWGLH